MTKLEKATYCLMILLCVVSISVLIKHNFLDNGNDTSSLGGYADALVGQSERGIAPAAWQTSQNNVVLLLSSQCHFCEASIPLYRKLATLRHADHFSLLVVGAESPNVLRDYLRRNAIDVDNVLQLRSGFAGITFTPAIFIVNSHGIIEKAFLGKLATENEAHLLQFVSALKSVS